MDFTLPEELRLLRTTLRRFVEQELLPLENEYMHREGGLPPAIKEPLEQKVKDMGLWAYSAPVELGGAGLGLLATCVVIEEMSRVTIGDDLFGPNVPNLTILANNCNAEQREKYLDPCIRGEKRSCFALTEPGAGSDAAAIQTMAVRNGDNYVLNGTKVFISHVQKADFALVFAVTDREKRARGGITCFIVDRGTPGFELTRVIETMGDGRPCEIVFQDCVVPASNVLGQVGLGFRVAQGRMGWRRVEIAAECIGAAERSLKLMTDYANQRVTFGETLASRQAVQWMIADSAVEIHATRLMTYDAASKWDEGKEIRQEASMAKLYASEMAGRVVDRALQVHGGLGYTRDLPIEKMYRNLRVKRIIEGASEIHRFVIARNVLSGLWPVG
ncbi:MAG: acyl-CoA dehydrogenase family protein [Dehalococcoidia bacterium]|nr:acyl-CoA dehydrogenase family protein [Dehalococcoidia bacterium]